MKTVRFLAHLFLPQESNNHKAKVIQPSGFLVLAFSLLAYQLVMTFFPRVNPQVLGYAANIPPDEIIRLTNEKRAENGLLALKSSEVLSLAAQAKAADMINKGYWAHVAPDGTQPWKFFVDAGYRYKYAGENLARDFSDPASTVNAWMASPSHRENLLSDKYREIGVAVIEGNMGGVDTTIVVQLFGTTLAEGTLVKPVAAASLGAESGPLGTPAPSPLPVPTTQPVVAAPNRVAISPLNLTKQLSGLVILILLAVLVADMIIIRKKRITRVSGRSLAHIAFFGMVFAIIIIAKAGRIL